MPAEYHDMDDIILKEIFPYWKELIYEVDISHMELICSDLQEGYLYCDK